MPGKFTSQVAGIASMEANQESIEVQLLVPAEEEDGGSVDLPSRRCAVFPNSPGSKDGSTSTDTTADADSSFDSIYSSFDSILSGKDGSYLCNGNVGTCVGTDDSSGGSSLEEGFWGEGPPVSVDGDTSYSPPVAFGAVPSMTRDLWTIAEMSLESRELSHVGQRQKACLMDEDEGTANTTDFKPTKKGDIHQPYNLPANSRFRSSFCDASTVTGHGHQSKFASCGSTSLGFGCSGYEMVVPGCTSDTVDSKDEFDMDYCSEEPLSWREKIVQVKSHLAFCFVQFSCSCAMGMPLTST